MTIYGSEISDDITVTVDGDAVEIDNGEEAVITLDREQIEELARLIGLIK